MSDETVKKQLTESLKNPQFEVWNSTSISHLNIIKSGHNGEENKQMAIKLLNQYREWQYYEEHSVYNDIIKLCLLINQMF